MDACIRTVWVHASVQFGRMHPYSLGACIRTVWTYASVQSGRMRPCCLEACARVTYSGRKDYNIIKSLNYSVL